MEIFIEKIPPEHVLIFNNFRRERKKSLVPRVKRGMNDFKSLFGSLARLSDRNAAGDFNRKFYTLQS